MLTEFIAETSLHVIAYDKKKKFAVCNGKENRAYFVYSRNKDCLMKFDLLSHCIYEYREWAEQLLSDLNYKIGTEDTATEYYNTIIKDDTTGNN